MDNQTYKYSAFFKMYGDENLQVSFNIVENDLSQHLLNLQDLLGLLKSQGYTVEAKEHIANEEIQEVTGWVLAKTKKDELCVHLYGPEHLQWKVITVWQEDLEKLPIKISPKLQPIIGSAPEREVAVRMKLLQPLPVGTKVVLEPVINFDGTLRLNDKGKVVKKFSRMAGQPKVASVVPAPKIQTTLLEPQDENFYADGTNQEIDSYPQIAGLFPVGTTTRKFIDWCRKQQEAGKVVAKQEDFMELSTTLDSLVENPGAGDAILSVLSGLESIDLSDKIGKSLVTSLLKWTVKADEHGVVNPAYEERYVEAIKEIYAKVEALWEQ